MSLSSLGPGVFCSICCVKVMPLRAQARQLVLCIPSADRLSRTDVVAWPLWSWQPFQLYRVYLVVKQGPTGSMLFDLPLPKWNVNTPWENWPALVTSVLSCCLDDDDENLSWSIISLRSPCRWPQWPSVFQHLCIGCFEPSARNRYHVSVVRLIPS